MCCNPAIRLPSRSIPCPVYRALRPVEDAAALDDAAEAAFENVRAALIRGTADRHIWLLSARRKWAGDEIQPVPESAWGRDHCRGSDRGWFVCGTGVAASGMAGFAFVVPASAA
jgi:hypothetical protein